MQNNIVLDIVSVSIATGLIRCLPVLLLAKRELPEFISKLLLFIPPAIMATIIANGVISDQVKTFFNLPAALPACIIAFLIGYPTRNLFLTILASVLAYLLFQHIHWITPPVYA